MKAKHNASLVISFIIFLTLVHTCFEPKGPFEILKKDVLNARWRERYSKLGLKIFGSDEVICGGRIRKDAGRAYVRVFPVEHHRKGFHKG